MSNGSENDSMNFTVSKDLPKDIITFSMHGAEFMKLAPADDFAKSKIIILSLEGGHTLNEAARDFVQVVNELFKQQQKL